MVPAEMRELLPAPEASFHCGFRHAVALYGPILSILTSILSADAQLIFQVFQYVSKRLKSIPVSYCPDDF